MKNKFKRVLFPTVLIALLVFFTIETAAITTPWIDIPDDTGTVESEELPDQPDETTARNETNTESRQSAETPKKKGCGSMISQNGVGLILMVGMSGFPLLSKRKSKLQTIEKAKNAEKPIDNREKRR